MDPSDSATACRVRGENGALAATLCLAEQIVWWEDLVTERDLKLVSPGGDRVPDVAPFHNEGMTPAAWVMAISLMVAALLVAIGMIASITWLIIAGVVLGAVGLIASGAMRAAGMGQPPVKR